MTSIASVFSSSNSLRAWGLVVRLVTLTPPLKLVGRPLGHRAVTSAVLALSLGVAALSAQASTSLKATVNGMVCAFCAQGIEKRIGKMSATQFVFVDLKGKTVAVQAKDGMSLDEKAIAAEITESGYDVVKLETVQKTVAQIKADLKSDAKSATKVTP